MLAGRFKGRRSGFTLVEILLAIGMMSTVLFLLFELLTHQHRLALPVESRWKAQIVAESSVDVFATAHPDGLVQYVNSGAVLRWPPVWPPVPTGVSDLYRNHQITLSTQVYDPNTNDAVTLNTAADADAFLNELKDAILLKDRVFSVEVLYRSQPESPEQRAQWTKRITPD